MAKKKIEKFPEMTESELLYELLWKKYGAIDPEKVIYAARVEGGGYHLSVGGKKIKEADLKLLKDEASMIQRTQLWKMLTEAKKNAAHTHLFKGMKTLDDSHYGKAILYAISIDDLVLETLDAAQVQTPAKSAQTQFMAQRQ